MAMRLNGLMAVPVAALSNHITCGPHATRGTLLMTCHVHERCAASTVTCGGTAHLPRQLSRMPRAFGEANASLGSREAWEDMHKEQGMMTA